MTPTESFRRTEWYFRKYMLAQYNLECSLIFANAGTDFVARVEGEIIDMSRDHLLNSPKSATQSIAKEIFDLYPEFFL